MSILPSTIHPSSDLSTSEEATSLQALGLESSSVSGGPPNAKTESKRDFARLFSAFLCLILLFSSAGCSRGSSEVAGGEAGETSGETAGETGADGDEADGEGGDDDSGDTDGEGEESGDDEDAEPQPTVDRRVDQVVTADGELRYPDIVQNLSFSSSGRLIELAVAPDQVVAQGDLIGRIDPTTLDLAVIDARTALLAAQARVAELDAGTDIERARLQWEQSKNNRWGSQAIRDATCGREKPFFDQASCDQSESSVNAAEQSVQLAKLTYESLTANQDADYNSARNQLRSAQLNLSRAQEQRELATLTAPLTGTITTVSVIEGVDVGPGSPIAMLTVTDPLRFVTSNLSERYIGDIALGDQASLTLTAYPEKQIPATISRIDRQGTRDQRGEVVFEVSLDLEPEGEIGLYAGMTGRAEITLGASTE